MSLLFEVISRYSDIPRFSHTFQRRILTNICFLLLMLILLFGLLILAYHGFDMLFHFLVLTCMGNFSFSGARIWRFLGFPLRYVGG